MKLIVASCRCPLCGEHFATDAMFDQHRVGKPAERRCLKPLEMPRCGFFKDAAGHWFREPRRCVVGAR